MAEEIEVLGLYSGGNTGVPLSVDSTGKLNVNVVSGSGTNASVGTNGATAPASSTQIAYVNAGGNLTADSLTNALPITGSVTAGVSGTVTATVASTGTNGATAPASSTQIAFSNSSGNLTAISPTSPIPGVETYKFSAISASSVVKSSAGTLGGLFVSSTSGSPTITIYDNTSGTTTPIIAAFTPAAGTPYPFPCNFSNGLNIVISGTTSITVFYQ